jgi:hypothetical protein
MLIITKCSVFNKSHIRTGSNNYIGRNVKLSKEQLFSNDLNSCFHIQAKTPIFKSLSANTIHVWPPNEYTLF